jgi:hypothetical protein
MIHGFQGQLPVDGVIAKVGLVGTFPVTTNRELSRFPHWLDSTNLGVIGGKAAKRS